MNAASVTNIEFKARVGTHEPHRVVLEQMKARYAGRDHQIDTYFRCNQGRLKLREGAIESALIFYERRDEADVKRSDVHLHQVADSSSLKAVLEAAYEVEVVVEKFRDIYFVDNVKVHLDDVPGLGLFVEVEAIDAGGRLPVEALQEQCRRFREEFDVDDDEMVALSYADLVRESSV